jgi:hypothetical protein
MSSDRQALYPNIRKGGGKGTAKNTRRAGNRAWKPGQSGNPKGRPKGVPNKVTREIREFAQSILEDPQVQARTLEDARRGRLAPPIAALLYAYAYGKPKERVELEVLEALHLTITNDLGEDVEPQAPTPGR